MSNQLRVLFLAAEADPFVKVGGLGDVAGSLPRALRELSPELTDQTSVDIRLVLPFHPVLRSKISSLNHLASFPLSYKDAEISVEVYDTNQDGLPVYFIGGGRIERRAFPASFGKTLTATARPSRCPDPYSGPFWRQIPLCRNPLFAYLF